MAAVPRQGRLTLRELQERRRRAEEAYEAAMQRSKDEAELQELVDRAMNGDEGAFDLMDGGLARAEALLREAQIRDPYMVREMGEASVLMCER